jgi:pimeloyl-ACP methyl ester carboxylesterase
MRRLALVTAASIATLGLCAGPAGARTDDRAKPVILIHGFSANSTNDCRDFQTFRVFLRGRGFTNDLSTLAFYSGDTNCRTSIGAHGRTFAVRHNEAFGGPGEHVGSSESQHNNSTDLRHLAYHFAWYLHNTYGRRGVTVDIVAHSMGGLITRSALQRVDRRIRNFPPRLPVEDVVTMGTPHGGSGGFTFSSLCFGLRFIDQCGQMDPNSSFLRQLNENSAGRHPQPSNGSLRTHWTTLGSADDQVVPPQSSLAMGQSDVGVFYADSMDYNHDAYFEDQSLALDAEAQADTTTDDPFTSAATYGSLRVVDQRGANLAQLALFDGVR